MLFTPKTKNNGFKKKVFPQLVNLSITKNQDEIMHNKIAFLQPAKRLSRSTKPQYRRETCKAKIDMKHSFLELNWEKDPNIDGFRIYTRRC